MRLIDADALFTEMENTGWYDNADRDEVAEELVLSAPAIDAVPVVHGEWIEAKSGSMSLYPVGQKMCSACKRIMPSAWKKMPPYCFGCGALMDAAETSKGDKQDEH